MVELVKQIRQEVFPFLMISKVITHIILKPQDVFSLWEDLIRCSDYQFSPVLTFYLPSLVLEDP